MYWSWERLNLLLLINVDILKASILIGMMVIFRGQSQNDTFQVWRLNPGLGPNGDDVTRGLSSLTQ
jgi:hypothetical protein